MRAIQSQNRERDEIGPGTRTALNILNVPVSQIVIERGDLAFDAKMWTKLCCRAAALIDEEHKAHPDRVGLELAHLRRALTGEMTTPELFGALVCMLYETGFACEGKVIHRVSHRPALPPELEVASAKIRAALAERPFDPPSRKEIAPDLVSQQALRFLQEAGVIEQISADVVLLSDALAKMRESIVEFIRSK